MPKTICCLLCPYSIYLFMFPLLHLPNLIQVLGEESRSFPEFRNLNVLLLCNCDLSDDFRTLLGHYLQNSPNLRKLTLWHCKVQCTLILRLYKSCVTKNRFTILHPFPLCLQQFADDSKKKKGTSKSKKNPPSQCQNLVDIQCENLKHTEIVYRDDDIRQLVELLLRLSGNFSNNSIKLTRVSQ